MTDQAQLELELLDREQARCSALMDDRMDALAALLSDDLVHVHTTGVVHGKDQLIHHAGTFLRFIDVSRGQLLIRRLGDDAAIMTGPMTNVVRRRDQGEPVTVQAFVTQVWARSAGVWQIASFHAVRLPDQAA